MSPFPALLLAPWRPARVLAVLVQGICLVIALFRVPPEKIPRIIELGGNDLARIAGPEPALEAGRRMRSSSRARATGPAQTEEDR